jgi:hypothetical protein
MGGTEFGVNVRGVASWSAFERLVRRAEALAATSSPRRTILVLWRRSLR